MSDAIAVFLWWLIIQILGLAVWPLLTRWLRWLPDRGYMLAKPVGLLFVSYGLWILATFGLIENSAGGIVIVLIGVAALSMWAWRGFPTSSAHDDRADLRGLWREHRALFVAYEILFAVALIAWAAFRAHAPDLSSTEKPMEFAFFNAINRSATFPPLDPWLSGYAIAYYYFGYVMMSALHKLTGVTPGITFSLSNAFWFALAAASAFGVVANLVLLFKREAKVAAIIFATLGAVMLGLMGNFQAPLEVAHANDIGSPEFWRWLDILEINGPAVQNPPDVPWWTPRQGWWWWRSSRVIHDYPPDQVSPLLARLTGLPAADPSVYQEAIDEFPQFSYILGDMHPHVLALPFALVMMALALNLYQGAARGEITSLWSGQKHAPLWPLYALAVGSLSFLNTWDFPIYAFVLVAALGLGYWRTGHPRWWRAVVVDLIVLGAIGVALYLPFYRGFSSQAGGIAPNLYNGTRIAQFFVMFGPFLTIGFMFGLALIYQTVRGKQARWPSFIAKAVAGGIGVVVALALLAGMLGLGMTLISEKARTTVNDTIAAMAQTGLGLSDQLHARLLSPWTPLLLGIALASIVLLWIARRKQSASDQAYDARSPIDFVLLLFGVGLLLTIGTEFGYIVDGFGTRMNTIFKFYYQAWALWAVASAFAAFYLITGAKLNVLVRGVATIIVLIVVALGMFFPLMAIPGKVEADQPMLDALEYTARVAPDDYAATLWLNQNTQDNPVILEAPGDEYNASMSRLSTWTGLPSVVGWAGHEGQWRGNYDIQGPRITQIQEIYTTADANRMLDLLKELNVRFVIVGPNEQRLYPPTGLAKFGQYLPLAFQQGQIAIYQVP